MSATELCIKFYSGSKLKEAQLLSNFHEIPGGLMIDTPLGKMKVTSVESGFQYLKFFHSSPKEIAMKEAEKLLFDGENSNPKASKKAGGKGAMKKAGVILNTDEWNKTSQDYMSQLVTARIEQDYDFRNVLKWSFDKGIKLLHHERNPKLWGCHADEKGKIKKGENLLGEILMKVSRDFFEEKFVKRPREEDGEEEEFPSKKIKV
jgi:predicted NAD-dependent protein-ADP-ribosyltransferase YbiA (DUF1768 family)